MATFDDVVHAISLHSAELERYPGVIAVRPGYKFKGSWITEQPAIVVTVLRKLPLDQLDADERVPSTIDGVPVDVEPATPAKQVLALNRSLPSPSVTTPGLGASAQIGDTLLSSSPDGTQVKVESASAAAMPSVSYVPPAGTPLAQATGPFSVTCSVSPDSGWGALQGFLGGVRSTLTMAMYEFTAPHVRDAILGNNKIAKFALISDPGMDPLIAGDDEEPDLVCRLKQRFQETMDFYWALTPAHGRVKAKAFPTSYHIKVAVADSENMWLSSGNLKSSNQPLTTPANPIPSSFWSSHDRDWHVIVRHQEFASTFEKYIQNDMRLASQYQKEGPCDAAAPLSAPMPDLLVPIANALVAPATAGEPAVFAAQDFDLGVGDSIQQVMTPDADGFASCVGALISQATAKVYFQNQYIKQGATGSALESLISALVKKAKQPGVDVRIILRDETLEPQDDLRLMLEQLVHAGIPAVCLKLQPGVHNKGIVVDSSTVLICSQNWSPDGVQFNRDAGVIIRNAAVARYYERVFLYDWSTYAKQLLPTEAAMPQVAAPGTPTPAGMKRLTWGQRYRM